MTKQISSRVPDWSREKPRCLWDPGRRLLKSIRKYQCWREKRGPAAGLFRKYWVVQHRFWSVVTGAEIDLNCEIGGGLMIPHPNGIVIYPKIRIGPNCLIFQQVTIGVTGDGGIPEIGGHVDIGAGAKILGKVLVGEHAMIGANSVVLEDVPPGETVAGVPAQVIARS